MNSKYAIQWKEGESIRSVTYPTREAALKEWEKAADRVYYPQIITLYKDDAILSHYSPMESMRDRGGD